MTASIHPALTPAQRYVLRIGDTCLVLGQRLAEWCGHAPILEEDIALANIALDLIGQARAVLTHAGALDPAGYDEDQLAFLREERHYLNLTLAELPRGDFAFTIVRNAALAIFLRLLWNELAKSSDAELAGIAAKAVKEARYHVEHASEWLVRLADGSEESRRRTEAALQAVWPYTAELFAADAVDAAAQANGLGPGWDALRENWEAEFGALLLEGGLALPAATPFLSTGTRGVHSEHMGPMLATLQHLQRAYPGGVW